MRLPVTCRVISVLALSLGALATATLSAQTVDTTAVIRHKGLTITPIGYFAGEMLYRDRNETADLGSSFNAIPFDGTTNAAMSEFRGSARQSRIGLLFGGMAGQTKISGLWESDFLSSGTTSNSTESNSYTMRIRQFWGQANLASGWSVAAGQMWSLITSGKNGIAPRAEAVPLTIDAQYNVGFNWARQFALRLTNTISKQASFAIALEGAQTTFAARGAANNIVLGAVGGSQLNATANYSTDEAPDVIAKLAFDPGWGHFEIKGVASFMRERIIDPTNLVGGTQNSSATGTGIGVGVVLPLVAKKVDLSFSALTGTGIGRYGTSMLPDATVNTDATLAPLSEWQALASLEIHPTPMVDLYAYAGEEYADRHSSLNAAGTAVGYGAPTFDETGCMTEVAPTSPFVPGAGSPCNADTKDTKEVSVGFWHRFYKGSAGTLQWGMQYSHAVREAWDGKNGIAATGSENMLFMSFRFVLP
jgi:hypothetical protein